MAALTSTMSVVTMAALLLVIVAAMAVQTAATRPAADGYAAASTTAKPAEDGYAGAAATTTEKPVEHSTGGEAITTKPVEDRYAGAATTKSAEKTSGEATTPAVTAKPAKEGYAAATSPEKATTDERVTTILSSVAPTMPLGEKSAMETGAYYVSEKEVGAVSDGVRDRLHQLADSGEKGSGAFLSLVGADTHLRLAEKSLKDSTTATSPEKIIACKKAANADYLSAMLFIAASHGPKKGTSAAVGGTIDIKPATKQSTEAVAQLASDAYAAKVEASPKEEAGKQPATDAYTAKDTTPKEEAGKQPAADVAKVDVAPKEEASPKEAGKQPAANAYAAKDATPKEASSKDAYTAGTA